MNSKIDTDVDSPTYGQRLWYEEDDTLVGTWDDLVNRPLNDEAWEVDLDSALDDVIPAAPEPAPPTPKLDAAIARYVTRRKLRTTAQILAEPEPPWFVENLIPHSARMVVHGLPGSRKTFLALDWAVCAQHGLDWHGRNISQGKVLYVMGEGTSFLAKRLRALAKSKGMKAEDIKVTWMAEPMNLFAMDEDEVAIWSGFVRHFDLKYLFFDTLNMNTSGMEENSAKEMELALANATKIAGGPTSGRMVILIHHNTKTGGMRGSGALMGNCDTILEVKESGSLESKVKSDKIRDAEGFSDVALTFGEDDEHDSIFIKTVGAPTPAVTNAERIVNVCRAEPFAHTRTAICCMLGDSGAVQRSFKQCVDDGWIVSETRASKSNRGPRMVDTWGVDEKVVPFIIGAS